MTLTFSEVERVLKAAGPDPFDGAHAILRLFSAASRPPAEDQAGQGERDWTRTFDVPQTVGDWVQKAKQYLAKGYNMGVLHEDIPTFITALSAPAPSRPADREEIASTVAAAIMGMDWAQVRPQGYHEGNADEQDRRHGMVQEAVLLALRDAPRTGGDGTQEDHR